MIWSPVERTHAVEVSLVQGTTGAALRALTREWGRQRVPTRRTLERWVREFREGLRPGQAPPRTQPPRVPRAVLQAVRRAIRRNPRLSTRVLARRTGASRTTVRRVLRCQLGLFPYKLQLTQRLKRGDKAKRQRFARWLLDR